MRADLLSDPGALRPEDRTQSGATLRTIPEDFARLYPSTRGALYGRATHGWKASFAREGSATRLPGLYLAGGSVHPGPGVPMAALSGRQAAMRVMTDLTSTGRFRPAAMPGGMSMRSATTANIGLTVIAFVGSVFSPYYAWVGRRDPLDHCAFNVALYGPRRSLWAMTERRRSAVKRSRDTITIGRTTASWDRGVLVLDVDERAAPIPHRIRGRIEVRAQAINARGFMLEDQGRHWWRPMAPRARVSVDMEAPAMRWRGSGYIDQNAGDEPIEQAFSQWTWSRAASGKAPRSCTTPTGVARPPLSLALAFDRHAISRRARRRFPRTYRAHAGAFRARRAPMTVEPRLSGRSRIRPSIRAASLRMIYSGSVSNRCTRAFRSIASPTLSCASCCRSACRGDSVGSLSRRTLV